MAVTLPTVDDFTETTVLTMIRKVVDYLCSDSGLVAQINNNDITGFTSSYTNNLLKIDATKGDGTTIPVCSVTIEGGSSTGNPYPTGISGTVGADGNITFTVTMSSGSPLTTTINMAYFASADDISDLQEQVSGIKPSVTVNDEVSPPTITVAVNGTSSTANLPSSGGDNWEELNLSSLPTDFSATDRVEITLKNIRTINSFDDWNVAPTLRSSPIINTDSLYRVEITPRADSNAVISTLAGIELETNFGPIALLTVNPNNVLQWNGTSLSDSLFTIEIQVFSGAGVKGNNTRISRSNITNYVTRIRRIKNYYA